MVRPKKYCHDIYYLNPIFFRAPLIFAYQRRAKINGALKRPIFAQFGARKLIAQILDSTEIYYVA